MRRFEKLKENYDFKRLYFRGRSYVAPCFVMYVAKGRKSKVRLGITAGKKLGGAVCRNRAKRVITAAFESISEGIISGYDFVIVARIKILDFKSPAVADILKEQLRSAGIWCDDEAHS